jgi:hypothetical protein
MLSLALALGVILLALGAASPARAGGGSEPADEVSLPPTLVTEGAPPATEAEAVFQTSRSRTERTFELAPSFQYAPVPWFGIKLVVPLDGRDPREEPAQGGVGDVSVVAKYAPLLLAAQQFAAAGGLKLTLPTGDTGRGLGGEFAVSPFLAVGKGFGLFSVQADASYSWQLNRPPPVEAGEDGEDRRLAHKEHGASANLAATVSPIAWLGLIFELNSVTRIGGENDDRLKERVQLYVTPGLSVEPAEGWNVRGGIQLPLTSAKQFDYNIIVILTKGF